MPTKPRKIILSGSAEAGKTSMRSMVFANYSAEDTHKIGPTTQIEFTNILIFGRYKLNVYDLAGQQAFRPSYIKNQSEMIYQGCQLLIFVIDCMSPNFITDIDQLVEGIASLEAYSKNSSIIVLIHKVDLIDGYKQVGKENEYKRGLNDRRRLLENEIIRKISETDQIKKDFKKQVIKNIRFRLTTIYDDSLYSAWGEIISIIAPNIAEYERKIKKFAKEIKADEVVLFEKRTFLSFASCRAEYLPKQKQREVIENLTSKLKLMHNAEGEEDVRYNRNNFTLKNNNYQMYFRSYQGQMHCILVVFYKSQYRENGNMELIDYYSHNNEKDQSSLEYSTLSQLQGGFA